MLDHPVFQTIATVARTDPEAGAQVWGADPHGSVWTLEQADQGGAWSYWAQHGDTPQPIGMSVLAASADASKTHLYLYGLDAQGKLWASIEDPSSETWSPWQGPGYASQTQTFTAVTAAHDEIWCLDASGTIWTCWGSPGSMSGWVVASTPFGAASSIVAVTRHDGSVALYATDRSNLLWSCWQTSEAGLWTSWTQVPLSSGQTPQLTAFVGVSTNSSIVMLWGTDTAGSVWYLPLGAATEAPCWQGPSWNSQPAPVGPIAVASQNDGSLILFGVGSAHALWDSSQNVDGSWNGWSRRVVPCIGDAFVLDNRSDAEAFFLAGPPASWNGENGGVHTLVLPGMGLLRFADGPPEYSPNQVNPNARILWPITLSDTQGGRGGVFHDLDPLLIGIDDGGSYSITTQGATNPSWTVSGPIRDGEPWIDRKVYRPGERIVVNYDTTFYGGPVDLCIVRSSEAYRANPQPVAMQSVNGKGTVDFPVPDAGGYVLKGCIDGRAVLGHGRLMVKSGSRSMPAGRHIMSTTAAGSDTALHMIVTVMDAGHRSMWHGVGIPGSDAITWTQSAGGEDFPVAESEIVLHSDGSLTYFALDGDGRIRMKHGDDAWSSAGWNGQPVAFSDLSASHENGILAIYALDESGSLWSSAFGGTSWGSWQAFAASGIPTFVDISSAAGYVAGVDGSGELWFSAPGSASWVQAVGGSGSFLLVDMTWDPAASQASLWVTDGEGGIWSGAIVQGAATMTRLPTTGPLAFTCPVPVTGDFCVVQQGARTFVWAVSGLIQIWGGVLGETMWDGPTWGGLRLEPAPPIMSVAAFVDAPSGKQTILVAALDLSRASGTSLWTGSLDASVNPPEWDLWNPEPAPDGQSLIAEIVAAHAGASRVWARNAAGQFFAGSLSSGDLTWQPAMTGIAARIAAALLPDGTEAAWIVRPDGSVEQGVAVSGAVNFSPVPGVVAREIAAVSSEAASLRRTLVIGVDPSRVPFDFYASSSTVPVVRSPAFGIPAPSVMLMSMEMGTWSGGSKLRAFALDADGWLWSVAEDGSDNWGSAWEGPRWKGQPARFSRVQCSGDVVFAVDTAGLLWRLDASTDVWEGPDWGHASMLSNSNPPLTSSTLHSAALLAGSEGDGIATSRRSTQPLVNPSSRGGRYVYGFMIEAEDRTSVFQVTQPAPGSPGQYFLNGPTDVSYPNDPILYPATGTRMPMGFIKNLLFPATNREQATQGAFEIVTVQQTTSRPVVTRFFRTVASAPYGSVPGRMTRHLRMNPILAFYPGDSSTDRDRYRRMTAAAVVMMVNLFARFSLTVEVLPVQEVEVGSMVNFDLSLEPTASLLKQHARDDSINVIWATAATGRLGAGIAGGLPGVRSANPDFTYFGVLALLTPIMIQPSAEWLSRNTSHEICHFLGLTHESSRNVANNLMLTNVNVIGPNLEVDQLWIVQNSVMAEERIAYSTPDQGISIIEVRTSTQNGWGLFDGPGTDVTMRISLLRTDGSIVWTGNLGESFAIERAFSAGNNDLFHFSLPKLDLSLLATARIEWAGSIFSSGDTWSSNGFHVRLFNNSRALLATADVSQPFSLSYGSPYRSAPVVDVA
ncbi:hypothetical protein [Janthinobacterium sp. HLX7-2]|uniref:hypothetical protein n=1 Tax=Janthinobacterium sp. HLX7-2 TaxID=1259331 RepID=UPI003F21AF46